MKKLRYYAEDELDSYKMKDLVLLYNVRADRIGQSQVKKFRDLKTARVRFIKIQNDYSKWEAENFKVEEPTPKKVKKVKKAKKKPDGMTIKTLTLDLITKDKEDAEIVSEVKKQFPDSAFNNSHVSWYRSTLFRDGIVGPEHAPRRSYAYKQWKKEQN